MRNFVGSIAAAAVLIAAGAAFAAAAPAPLTITEGPGEWWNLDFGAGYKQYATKLENAETLQVIPSAGAAATNLPQAMNAPAGATVAAYRLVSAPFLTAPLCADKPANWVAVMYPPQGTPVLAAITWANPGDQDSTICRLTPVQANNPES